MVTAYPAGCNRRASAPHLICSYPVLSYKKYLREAEASLKYLYYFDNNDTDVKDFMRVALILQPSERKMQPFRRNAVLIKTVRQIGI